jgi:outer membrane murein-binding lipoprotein Lpp
MNKRFLLVAVVAAVVFVVGCDLDEELEQQRMDRAATRTATNASVSAQVTAQEAVPVPNVQHFQERSTIARWAKHWDKVDQVCYVYLFVPGVKESIGYYVTKGRPASTKSYLTPSYRENYYSSGGVINTELPDIDGTYGDNNAGIRFFTASGIAVEFAGAVSYIYSDKPLPMNVPLLGN